jgi:hypothetical protein
LTAAYLERACGVDRKQDATMNTFVLMIVPLETTDDADPKYQLGVGRSDGQPGFSSSRFFLTLEDLTGTLSQVRSISTALGPIDADMKSKVTRILNVTLSEDDLSLLGVGVRNDSKRN